MTIAPVPDNFVLKRKDAYTMTDAGGRAIELPGHPYGAVRIRREP